MKFKRNGRFYTSTDGKWLISTEGRGTWWYAVELDENGYTDEYTKQYFRSYNEAKSYVNGEYAKAVA